MRERRRGLGLSLRDLARSSGVSSSYLASLEVGRNTTTGKPAAPSVRVLGALAEALDLELSEIMRSIGLAGPSEAVDAHALLYVLGNRPPNALANVAQLCPDVDRWVYVPDPRESRHEAPGVVDPLVALRCDWPLGEPPYPDHRLRPARLAARLSDDLRLGDADTLRATDSLGMAIADCSAVMRWVENPDAAIENESVWPAQTERVFRETLGFAPAANVCVYHHADLETIAMPLDLLGAVLTLLRTHTVIGVLNLDGELETGSVAARSVLRELKPPGVSSNSWRDLSSAAARSLAEPSAAPVVT